ncbi:hypothetical protein [Nocardiopsis synnemataformans]|uniref:hypothetical protein n=1 Tax=Nocardiopsis synnemataformans TaxID=61305 RepID=UPI003EB7888C
MTHKSPPRTFRPVRGTFAPRTWQALAVLATGSLLVACGGPSGTGSSSADNEPGAPALPSVSAYDVADGEPAPGVKRSAVRFLETVFNYEAEEGTADAARERLTAAGLDSEAVTDAGLFPGDGHAGAAQVVYPQLGGLTDDQASIMAVTEISTLLDDSLTSVTRVIDLRLDRRGEAWEVTEVASIGSDPAAPEQADPTGTPAPESGSEQEWVAVEGVAAQVLDSSKIDLPSSARWDVLAGDIDERVLQMMLDITADHTISVAVLSTGHPVNVFDSSSVSNHTNGRAVDIWAIDGITVADLRQEGPQGPAGRLMEMALAEGATEVGGPWALSTTNGATFTDTVHEDHLHIGFKQ